MQRRWNQTTNSQSVSYKVEAWDKLQYLFKVKNINDHTLHFVATLSGKLDLERFKHAVNLSAEAFPLIRCRLDETKGQLTWEDKGYTSDDMVHFLVSANTEESVTHFICKEIDAFDGPQMKAEVIRKGEIDKLCISMNHMLCDAAGFKEYLYMLCNIYINLHKKMNLHMAAMGNRKMNQVFKTFSLRDKFRILFGKNDMATIDPIQFDLEGDLSNPYIETRSIPQEHFSALKAYAKNYSATVNDMIVTAYVRVLYQLYGRTVIIPCTVDTRKYLPNRRTNGICNLCTNLTCNIGSEIGLLFEETLCKVKQVMDKEKSNISCVKSIYLMEKAFDLLPDKLARSLIEKNFSNPFIAFTNIGILDKTKLTFGSVKVTEAYMTGSIKYSPYFQLAISTFDDVATLSINLYGTESDRSKLSLFLDKLVTELQNTILI
ncbi:DUF1298 domain-containing protein [Anaerocolumna sedimenticola]|uniref:DUF1298 domain-containing protein n=1 Tax=Anaerocolumna sedimenticola TaxID=2696063 RepID=A0A6P1TTZ2_9FIRM|nr:WS/DGAT domain-containing protein [Anaerocolumna sedimenticola]QHQ62905.1 DUF1298 domain-containing protein [Anaerocolumna sedimenticola]